MADYEIYAPSRILSRLLLEKCGGRFGGAVLNQVHDTRGSGRLGVEPESVSTRQRIAHVMGL